MIPFADTPEKAKSQKLKAEQGLAAWGVGTRAGYKGAA